MKTHQIPSYSDKVTVTLVECVPCVCGNPYHDPSIENIRSASTPKESITPKLSNEKNFKNMDSSNRGISKHRVQMTLSYEGGTFVDTRDGENHWNEEKKENRSFGI